MRVKIPSWLNDKLYKTYDIYYRGRSIDNSYDFGDFKICYLSTSDNNFRIVEILYKNKLITFFTIIDDDKCLLSPTKFRLDIKLKEFYIICSVCGETIKSDTDNFDELCQFCYLYTYDNPESCFMCDESLGEWSKYECGHILHNSCVDQIENEKCPLCRTQLSNPEPYYGID